MGVCLGRPSLPCPAMFGIAVIVAFLVGCRLVGMGGWWLVV